MQQIRCVSSVPHIALPTWNSKAFQGKANSFVHHTQEVPDGEHHAKQAAIFDVDHQFMDIAQILIPAD
jgi:hypothetical protein